MFLILKTNVYNKNKILATNICVRYTYNFQILNKITKL